ncbi:2-hydroxyisoflavanone dehydratase, partial [Mucuna pruriens]
MNCPNVRLEAEECLDFMANDKEIVKELLPLIRVYKDGSVERLLSSPNVPPSSSDPDTRVSSKDIVIEDNPFLSARIFLPKSHNKHNQKLPIFVYFHGGAFCVESAFSFFVHRYLNILASEANIIAVSVDFRLLPHHPLPAAYEDGWTTLQWIASHATNNATKPEPWLTNFADFNKLYVGGDTSGANLAHNLLMRAGTETLHGDLRILGALLCCPFFWGSKPIGSEPVEEHDQSLAMKVWSFAWPDAHAGIDNPMINPFAPGSPSLATLGCSKMLITITAKDEFRDRDILYYETVKRSGWKGAVELFDVGDEPHAFQLFKPETDRAKAMIKCLASFLKEIVKELLPLIRVYKDGTVERLLSSPNVAASEEDPETGVSSKDIVIAENPFLSARIFLPKSHKNLNQKLPILVYFHGGAFCVESAFSFYVHRYLNILVSEANIIAISVDYRLLPHHPLPAAYQDGWITLQWIASHAINNATNKEPWLLDYADFNKVYVGGDTNGANLAHNVLMRAGNETLPGDLKILGALLCCPFFWGSKPIGSEPVEGHHQSLATKVWSFVYPDAPGGIDNPMVNPCAPGAPSLVTLGCSKILIVITGKDEFRDRDIVYHESVKKSGWKGELELFDAGDEEHAFQLYKPQTHLAKAMIKRLASFLV